LQLNKSEILINFDKLLIMLKYQTQGKFFKQKSFAK